MKLFLGLLSLAIVFLFLLGCVKEAVEAGETEEVPGDEVLTEEASEDTAGEAIRMGSVKAKTAGTAVLNKSKAGNVTSNITAGNGTINKSVFP